MLSILIHGDGEDLFGLPSSETKLENENHRNINLPGKAVPVETIQAFSVEEVWQNLLFFIGAR
jgi:hypothetical protein